MSVLRGTWVDGIGVRHELAGIEDRAFRTPCGLRTTDHPTEDTHPLITCIRCIGAKRPAGVLRGMSADMVYYDEAQDFSRVNPCGEITLGETSVCTLR